MAMKLDQQWLKINKDICISTIIKEETGTRQKRLTATLCSLQRATEIYDDEMGTCCY